MEIGAQILTDNDIFECYRSFVLSTPFDFWEIKSAAKHIHNISYLMDIAIYYNMSLAVIDFLFEIFDQRKTKKSMIHFQQWLVKNNFKSIIKYCHE